MKFSRKYPPTYYDDIPISVYRRSEIDTISLCGVVGEVGLESSSQLPPPLQVRRRRGHSVLTPSSTRAAAARHHRQHMGAGGAYHIHTHSASVYHTAA